MSRGTGIQSDLRWTDTGEMGRRAIVHYRTPLAIRSAAFQRHVPQRIVKSSPGLAVVFATGFVMYTPARADEASVNDASMSACTPLKVEAVMN